MTPTTEWGINKETNRVTTKAVSYTHLDVYKRQHMYRPVYVCVEHRVVLFYKILCIVTVKIDVKLQDVTKLYFCSFADSKSFGYILIILQIL